MKLAACFRPSVVCGLYLLRQVSRTPAFYLRVERLFASPRGFASSCHVSVATSLTDDKLRTRDT